MTQKILRPAAFLLGNFIRGLVRTLDARLSDYEDDTDVTTELFTTPAIYIFWHENILLPFVTRSRCGMTLLVSQHRDANWLGWMAQDFGYHTVRGSSTKGGLKAILQYRKEHQSSSLVVTPDGPKGPRRVLAPGCIQLSSLLQVPIIPVGIGYHRPYRTPTWDRFAIPRPGTRGRLILGARMSIPRKLDEAGIEEHRQWVEISLHQLTYEAESWALDGQPRQRERSLHAALLGSSVNTGSLGLA
ncbi:MAG: lysophospholipid acyltransferase family protein [Pirellula sp.]